MDFDDVSVDVDVGFAPALEAPLVPDQDAAEARVADHDGAHDGVLRFGHVDGAFESDDAVDYRVHVWLEEEAAGGCQWLLGGGPHLSIKVIRVWLVMVVACSCVCSLLKMSSREIYDAGSNCQVDLTSTFIYVCLILSFFWFKEHFPKILVNDISIDVDMYVCNFFFFWV